MKCIDRLYVACTTFAMLMVLSLTATASPRTRSSSAEFLEALNNGNVQLVNELIKSIGVNPILGKMANAQMQYDMPLLANLASQCERRAIKVKTALTDAVYCATVATGAYTSLGDVHARGNQVLWDYTQLTPAVKGGRGSASTIAKTARKFEQQISGIQPVSETWNSATESVNTLAVTGDGSAPLPAISISVDGHRLHASLDLAPGGPPDPLVLVEGLSKGRVTQTLGLREVPDGQSHRRNSVIEKKESGGLYIADTVRIGPLVLHHFGVDVVTTPFIPPGAYIRASLLRRFGSVIIARNKVVLSRDSVGSCTGAVPMVFAADDKQNGALVFDAAMHGRPIKAALDLGDPHMLTTMIDGMGELTGSGAHALAGRDLQTGSPALLRVGQTTISAPQPAASRPTQGQPYRVKIGRRVLRSYSIDLSFGHSYPTVCFARG